jgi:hypothetical protein
MELINKVTVTPEAVFDYEECLEPDNRPRPSWRQLLAAVGCDWGQALRDAGYDKRKARKAAGCFWADCLKAAENDRAKAKVLFNQAKANADDILNQAVSRATDNTQEYQAAAFELAERYEQPLRKLDGDKLSRELAEYINRMNDAGRLLYERYFRCEYEDDLTGSRLMLFLYRGGKPDQVQEWDLSGICYAADWNEEIEYEGVIRNWLKEKVKDPPDYDDWAVTDRVNKILTNTEKTLWVNVLKEVQDAFECERDKEYAEKVAFLQSYAFSFRKRRRAKKTG